MTLYDRLLPLRDEKYRAFQLKLIPGVQPESVLGVRTPDLRSLAKEIAGSPERDAFLNELPHACFEENLIHFFVIASLRDFDECTQAIDRFLPYVDCWPVSDQASPVSFRKNHQKLLPFVKKWIASDHVYTARFGMRIMMNEFLDADFKTEYLDIVSAKQAGDYYLKMMQAWFFATALAKQYEKTVPYLENRMLDEWVRKKTIQKAVESFRITEEQKAFLKSLRK